MKKANLLLVFLLTAALLLPSCRNAVPGESENNTTPTPDSRITPKAIISGSKININYVKFDDINPEVVPEIKIGPVDESFQCVKEVEDGFLCGYISSLVSFGDIQKQRTIPTIKKLDKEGNVVWEKQYDYEVNTGMEIIPFYGLKNIISYPDGSFVFSVQMSIGLNSSEKSFIIKCDRDGNELWKRDFDDYSCEAIRSLLITEKGEIIVVGNARFMDGKQTNGEEGDFNIVMTKFDKDGTILQQKSFGGKSLDMVYAAWYDKKLGIIFRGVTDSKDGEFAISNERENAQFTVRIDKKLNFKWVFHANEGEHFIYDQIAIGDDCVYIPGGFNTEPIEEFLIKVDTNGKVVWKKSGLCSGLLIKAISVLKNGDIAVGTGLMNQGMLLILDKDGIEKKREETAVDTITPIRDGGFITTTTREIKTVPMPITSSTIWYDTDLAAVKYKSDYSLEWRKTYDKVKDDRGEDFAFPFEDGKIAVE